MTFRIFIHTSYVSCMSQVKEEDSDEEEDIDENDPSRPQLVPIPPDPTDATDLKEGNHSIFDRCSLEVRRYTALIRVCCKADSTRKAYLHHLKNYKDWLVQHSRIQVGTEMESHLQGCRTSWLQEGLLSRSVDGVFRAQVQRIKRVWEEGGIVSTERAFHFLQWLADWLHGEKSGLRQAASALGFWAGIETIIRGTKRVPMIASSVSIAAILEAADKSWIRRELGYIPGQRNVAPASPYTPGARYSTICTVQRLQQFSIQRLVSPTCKEGLRLGETTGEIRGGRPHTVVFRQTSHDQPAVADKGGEGQGA